MKKIIIRIIIKITKKKLIIIIIRIKIMRILMITTERSQ